MQHLTCLVSSFYWKEVSVLSWEVFEVRNWRQAIPYSSFISTDSERFFPWILHEKEVNMEALSKRGKWKMVAGKVLSLCWQILDSDSSFRRWQDLALMMQRAPQPSCFDRVKLGFMIGCAVGMSSAALFGTYSALRWENYSCNAF